MKPRKPLKRSIKPLRRSPLKRLGRRGTKYKAERLAAKQLYASRFMITYATPTCQSCDSRVGCDKADFSHKVPAGRKSNCNGPEHGIYSCRCCHTWLETGPMSGEARKILIASPISMLTGGKVDWPEPLKTSLIEWHKTNGWVNG